MRGKIYYNYITQGPMRCLLLYNGGKYFIPHLQDVYFLILLKLFEPDATSIKRNLCLHLKKKDSSLSLITIDFRKDQQNKNIIKELTIVENQLF